MMRCVFIRKGCGLFGCSIRLFQTTYGRTYGELARTLSLSIFPQGDSDLNFGSMAGRMLDAGVKPELSGRVSAFALYVFQCRHGVPPFQDIWLPDRD